MNPFFYIVCGLAVLCLAWAFLIAAAIRADGRRYRAYRDSLRRRSHHYPDHE